MQQQYGCTELDAAFKVAEKIDQARGHRVAGPGTALRPENAMEQNVLPFRCRSRLSAVATGGLAGPGYWLLRWSRCC